MIEEVSITCPYCLEDITVVIDTSIDEQQYVEDCFVCCQPIQLTIRTDGGGTVTDLTADRENG